MHTGFVSSPPITDVDRFPFSTSSAGVTWEGNNITINTTRYNILLFYCLPFSLSVDAYVDFL